MVSSGTVPVRDGHLAWHRRAGPGPAMVLSHGLTDNGLCWTGLVDRLPAAFDIWMLDARGHGESARFTAGHPFDPARDIAEAMDAIGLARAVIMGHSVGALASARFAAAWPDRAAALILEDPPLRLPAAGETAEGRQARLAGYLRGLAGTSDADLLASGRAAAPDWDDAEFAEWARAKRQVDPAARLAPDFRWEETFAAIRAPTLLIHGESARGSMVDDASAARAAQVNPRIRCLAVAGAGHNVRRDRPAEVAQAVAGFLADVAA